MTPSPTLLHPLAQHFTPASQGPYLRRFGPAFETSETYCNKKLCFTATTTDILIETLYELSQQRGCYFVKFSMVPRGGLYLGRCFFVDADDVGKTWAYYKNHPKMMCSVQDDDFTAPFRPCRSWADEGSA